ncbi:MAG: glycosyltransferase [Elusimicrobia bacterium]|nr:glycosyltransferase [Elusimicrobiota bacterium]
MSKEKIFLSVIVYSHNDEKFIGPFLKKLSLSLMTHFENFDVTIVDDFSSDATTKEIRSVAKELPCTINLITLAWPHGQELAMLAASDFVIGDFIIEIERPEFNYPDDIFITLFKRATEGGCDVVSASPETGGRILSKVFYTLLEKLSPLKFEVGTEDIRLLTRRVLNRVTNDKNKVRFRKVLYKYSGFKYDNIVYRPTAVGVHRGKGWRDRLRTGIDTLVLFTDLGTKLAGFFSLVFLTFSVGVGLYALLTFFIRKDIASGWTTLMVVLSFGFSGIFLVLTLISKYLSITLVEVQKTRLYTVQNVERLESAD